MAHDHLGKGDAAIARVEVAADEEGEGRRVGPAGHAKAEPTQTGEPAAMLYGFGKTPSERVGGKSTVNSRQSTVQRGRRLRRTVHALKRRGSS
jgi:hypothetical protein